MSEFKVIETQEEFDKAIQKRLEQKDREVSERYKNYLSPDDAAALKRDFEGKLSDANAKLKEAQEKLDPLNQSIAELTTRAKTAEGKLLKQSIASAKGLPLELADRLIGESKEDLEKDAETMAGFLKPTSAPPMYSHEPYQQNGQGQSAKDGAMAAALSSVFGELLNQQ